MLQTNTKHPHSDLLTEIGGTGFVAHLCEVSSQGVSKWRRNGIPQARMMFLRVCEEHGIKSIVRDWESKEKNKQALAAWRKQQDKNSLQED